MHSHGAISQQIQDDLESVQQLNVTCSNHLQSQPVYTLWLLKNEIKELQRDEWRNLRIFKLGKEDKIIEFPTFPPQAWSQSFLKNLYIGDLASMVGNYDITEEYPRYSLIVDLSDSNFEDPTRYSYIPIQPQKTHIQLKYGDEGTNFNEIKKALQENKVFDQINTVLESNGRVLINCVSGQSRSATVAILYLMETFNIGFVQAYRHIQKARPEICPHPAYVQSLLNQETEVTSPILYKQAENWLKEFVSDGQAHSLFSEVNESNQDILSQEDRNSSYIKIKFKDDQFIDIISFLKLLRIPFEISNCTKFSGEIQLEYKNYQQCRKILNSKTLDFSKSSISQNKSSFFSLNDIDNNECRQQVMDYKMCNN